MNDEQFHLGDVENSIQVICTLCSNIVSSFRYIADGMKFITYTDGDTFTTTLDHKDDKKRKGK